MRLRRSPIVLTLTGAGVAFVLAFNTHGRPATLAEAGSIVPSANAASTAAGAGSGGSGGGAGPGPQTVTGSDSPNQYGDVQVQVTVAGGRITDVTAVALPSADARSQEISSIAGPQLASQAISAQSAAIDGVSGATYTSNSYEASLQSAIDQIALKS